MVHTAEDDIAPLHRLEELLRPEDMAGGRHHRRETEIAIWTPTAHALTPDHGHDRARIHLDRDLIHHRGEARDIDDETVHLRLEEEAGEGEARAIRAFQATVIVVEVGVEVVMDVGEVIEVWPLDGKGSVISVLLKSKRGAPNRCIWHFDGPRILGEKTGCAQGLDVITFHGSRKCQKRGERACGMLYLDFSISKQWAGFKSAFSVR